MNDAPASSSTSPAEMYPVVGRERVGSIDVLRGVAVLGMLTINIWWFSVIGAGDSRPTAVGDLTGANYAVWLVSHLLAELKFNAIFSMLFGAGIVLMSERAEARGRKIAGLHYRRMAWLMLFGLLHTHLLWRGDILYQYGMWGLVVYLLRRRRPGSLLMLGLLSIAVASALFQSFGWSIEFWPEAILPRSRMRVGGLMLIGMALFKLGIFGAQRSRGFYLALVASGALVGVPLILLGVKRSLAAGRYSYALGTQSNYWGSLLVALGWVALVMLVCKSEAGLRLTRPLAAVGRMAFTNYLLQTVLCTSLFYDHGFGLHVERAGQAAIVVAIWILQLVVSSLWLCRFRFGPVEWLWRSLSYFELQSMTRKRQRSSHDRVSAVLLAVQ